MPWKAEWLVHGRPPPVQDFSFNSEDESVDSDHSSSYDGGGDSLTDSAKMSSPPSSPESSLDPDDICACCYSYQKDMAVCSGCSDSNCFSRQCVKECVACKREVCNTCLSGELKLCPACLNMFETRDLADYNKAQSRLATYNRAHFYLGSPLEFQKVLDRISEAMGINPEYEARGEDGLERWPPLMPLPKTAEPGQAVIDAYVRPALLLVPPGAKFLSDKPPAPPPRTVYIDNGCGCWQQDSSSSSVEDCVVCCACDKLATKGAFSCPRCDGWACIDCLQKCARCGNEVCDNCVMECVPCETLICTHCATGSVCTTCHEVWESRSVHDVEGNVSVRTPLEFQQYLDKISDEKGVDPEYELRDEDGLEVWPPLLPLPEKAGLGQRTMGDFV